ncbi:hypothetical protein HIM_11352 [Hirsutella minnesotensis 3608]|uniref:Uncharacterized protein n=1 Tax=Hirsutella minnesotensis 3608 TaxID=1043627 RepID=A0A0F8A1B3_9HYPO|nr:hypothetical protein HIM_11352 [Hirsutella minnesotensis 3608]
MGREYRAYLLFTADKASPRRNAELFRRYVTVLAHSPRAWFRLRDCDALIRFTAAAALSSSDLDEVWFSDAEWEMLAELSAVLYDAIAFYKHRAEGETNNTFAYFPPDIRCDYYRQCRELLWALDAAWARNPAKLYVINFIRFFGGPIHMTMRRYRFVEEDLTIGRPETESVVEQARQNFKLWNRVDAIVQEAVNPKRYVDVISRESKLLFPGLATLLEEGGDGNCDSCLYQQSYGAETFGQFGGVQPCDDCKDMWKAFMKGVTARAIEVFPEILSYRHPKN